MLESLKLLPQHNMHTVLKLKIRDTYVQCICQAHKQEKNRTRKVVHCTGHNTKPYQLQSDKEMVTATYFLARKAEGDCSYSGVVVPISPHTAVLIVKLLI